MAGEHGQLDRQASGADRPAAGHLFPPYPRWAWVAAGSLLLAAVAVLVAGRGGTMVLLGTALAFGALATLLLSVPDGDPAAD